MDNRPDKVTFERIDETDWYEVYFDDVSVGKCYDRNLTPQQIHWFPLWKLPLLEVLR